MLCSRCTAIFDEPKFSSLSAFSLPVAARERDFNLHHPDLNSFEESLRAQCGLCARLMESLSSGLGTTRRLFNQDGKLKPEVAENTFSIDYRMAIETPKRTIMSFTTLARAVVSGKPSTQNAKIYMCLATEQRPLDVERIPSPNTGINSSALDILSSWISDCRESHTVCRRKQHPDSGRTFARILDVGQDLDLGNVTLRLQNEIPSDAPYITLSHCWGGVEIPTLTKSNYSQYLDGISIQELPQTFQDCIQVARHLKIRYLWIDSLCIIQDSHEDWLEQAGVMGEIYHSSYCTIAATRSKDPYGGLFTDRNSVLVTPLRVAIKTPDSKAGLVYYNVGDFSHKWATQLLSSSLCTRGWVVQERLLSPRVVHFTKEQLFWECAHYRTCEESDLCGIANIDYNRADFKKWDPSSDSLLKKPSEKELRVNYIWSSVKAMYGRETTEFKKRDLVEDSEILVRARRECYGNEAWTKTHPLILYWTSIVDTYVRAKLTRIDDKLVALAGLAKILHDRTGIRYIAGHWLYQIPRQLLWVHSRPPSDQYSDHYIAPSWSWASVAGATLLGNLKLDPILESNGAMDLIRVVEVTLSGALDEEEPMGQLRGGRLRIRGRLMPLQLDLAAWPAGTSRKDHLIQRWQGSTVAPPVGETFLVPVLFTRWNEKLPDGTANALILESVASKGTFRRIGTARLSNLCSLKEIIPQLYTAKSSYHEDADDDATSEGEATDNDDGDLASPTDNASPRTRTTTPLSPQQELDEKKISMAASPAMQRGVAMLRKKLAENTPNNPITKLSPASSQRVTNLLNLVESSARMLPGRPGDKLAPRSEESIRDLERSLQEIGGGGGGPQSGPVKVVFRHNMWTQKHVPKLPPKDAVAPHFYREYVDDDEDCVRYGHFVFDVI